MTHSQYKALMQTLDNAVNNGYLEDILAMSPEDVLSDIIDETGERTWEDVSASEMATAIRGWQDRQREG